MRRVGKQIVAITLAAAMMGSLTPEACTFLQNEIVYAAETNEASAPTVTRTELYKNEDANPLILQDWTKKTGMVQEKLLLHMMIPSRVRWEM